MTTAAETNSEKAIRAIQSRDKSKAGARRCAGPSAWKTARYTKGDIEATVVGITDEAAIPATAICRRC